MHGFLFPSVLVVTYRDMMESCGGHVVYEELYEQESPRGSGSAFTGERWSHQCKCFTGLRGYYSIGTWPRIFCGVIGPAVGQGERSE